ncbi:MAG: hypothetical protein HY558_00955 [Euryarchaeota archaeon]|nr:hypothetical protein [Euryarchaeota archaeon]
MLTQTETQSLDSQAGPGDNLEEAIRFYRTRGTLVTAARIAGVSVRRMSDLLYQRAVEEQNARRRPRPV